MKPNADHPGVGDIKYPPVGSDLKPPPSLLKGDARQPVPGSDPGGTLKMTQNQYASRQETPGPLKNTGKDIPVLRKGTTTRGGKL